MTFSPDAFSAAAKSGRLAANLQVMRSARGLRLVDLARLCGLSSSAISLIESGKRKPSIATFYKLCESLGVDAESMMEKDYKLKAE